MRRLLDVPPSKESGFASFVRASGPGEALRFRERDKPLYKALPTLEIYRCMQ